jgi:cysteine desulfurase
MQNFKNPALKKRVYLDHNATTPHSPRLLSKWLEFIEIAGNPSSIHQDSRIPKTILRETRHKISELLGCSTLEVIFNSGASEGNSSVLKSVYQILYKSRNEFLISQVEHPSIIKTAEYLASLGAVVHYIPVNKNGLIDLEFIKNKLSEKTALVSVMFANNETGSIFPIKQISEMAHSKGALMHSDCVQLLGKENINFKELNLDYASFSGHKFYSLKGTGFCFVKKSSPWVPLVHGGGQERGRRGGTENVLGIAALNIVLDDIKICQSQISEMRRLRDLMENLILRNIKGVVVTAFQGLRLSNTSSLVIDNVDGETLLMSLDLKMYSVSTGAACSSGNPEPSPVLLAMGLSRAEAQSSLRVSLGWETTEEQVNSFVQTLSEVIQKLRLINLEEKTKENVG